MSEIGANKTVIIAHNICVNCVYVPLVPAHPAWLYKGDMIHYLVGDDRPVDSRRITGHERRPQLQRMTSSTRAFTKSQS